MNDFPILLPVYRKKKIISCLEVWKKQGKVRENGCDEEVATLPNRVYGDFLDVGIAIFRTLNIVSGEW